VVTEDEDADGDAVLRVTIVFEGKPEALDREKLVGLVRHMRSQLIDTLNSEAFPILSFMSKNEAKTLHLEAS